MSFFDALRYIRASEGRKVCRSGSSNTVQWYTTPSAVGFKNQSGSVIANFSTEDILADDWEIVEA